MSNLDEKAAERTGSDDEKANESLHERAGGVEGLEIDPDAHLSVEERAAIVRLHLVRHQTEVNTFTTGQETRSQIGPQADTMALVLVSDILLGPHQHWKRQSRRIG